MTSAVPAGWIVSIDEARAKVVGSRLIGHEVFVANPRKLRAIYNSDRKRDKNDARMLAKIARMDPQLLHPVEHGGGLDKRKAVVAIARKLAVLMLTLWKHGCDYEPLRGAQPAQAA